VPNSPKKKPAKVAKKAGKKPAKRTAVAKKATVVRKATQEQRRNRNKELLAGDIAFYQSSEPKNYARRTKGNKNHPRGVALYSLTKTKGIYHTDDNTIKLTDAEYEKLAENPDAVPSYTPIYKGKKIVKYRNTRTGEFVTPYYRHQIFGKYFNSSAVTDRDLTNEEKLRADIYQISNKAATHARLTRHFDLASSYQLLHPDMTKNKIVASEDFQTLVGMLRSYNYRQYGITEENVEIIDQVQHTNLSIEDFKLALGEDEQYKEVLVRLGRRTPTDSGPVGESDRDHIKNVVIPYLQNLGIATTSEGEE
jgi:hypothetical protein